MNEVNELNFNETMKGYIIRAIKNLHEADGEYKTTLTEELEQRLWNGLSWAIDDITMEEARREYQK